MISLKSKCQEEKIFFIETSSKWLSKTFTRTIPQTNIITIIFLPSSLSRPLLGSEQANDKFPRMYGHFLLCLQGNYVRQWQHLHLNESMSVGFAPLVPPSLTTKASCEREKNVCLEVNVRRTCIDGRRRRQGGKVEVFSFSRRLLWLSSRLLLLRVMQTSANRRRRKERRNWSLPDRSRRTEWICPSDRSTSSRSVQLDLKMIALKPFVSQRSTEMKDSCLSR